MEFNRDNILNRSTTAKKTVVMDDGLRAYMLKVYNYMATGVLLTGIIAMLSFKMSVVTDASGVISGFTSFGNALFFSGFKWVVMLAPLGIVFYMSFGINKMSAAKAQSVFWIFAALMGLSLSWILLVYTGVSVARVFFITSATFGAMSIYGYTTKRDLTKMGSFLMMGLIGIIIASVVNILDPDVFIFGGGLSNEIDFFDEIQLKVKKFVAGNEFEGTMLKPKFGDASGVRGAARLGRTMSY